MQSAERSDALLSGVAATEIDGAAYLKTYQANQTAVRTAQLPSFLVLGPPRTGSTWLYDVLHTRALLPYPTKETRFFDVHFDRGLDWYRHHFNRESSGLVAGEIAPTYFCSPLACQRIRSVLPNAKLIIVFRNPLQRLVSLYKLKRAYGLLSSTLEEAIQKDAELYDSSLYATHLKMWQEHFPADQLSVNFFEDLTADPQGFLDRICEFAGIPQFQMKESERKEVFSTGQMTEPRSYMATKAALAVADWCKARKLDKFVYHVKNSRAFNLLIGGGAPFPPLPKESLAKVHAMLLPETEELEAMTGRDLSTWKTPPAA